MLLQHGEFRTIQTPFNTGNPCHASIPLTWEVHAIQTLMRRRPNFRKCLSSLNESYEVYQNRTCYMIMSYYNNILLTWGDSYQKSFSLTWRNSHPALLPSNIRYSLLYKRPFNIAKPLLYKGPSNMENSYYTHIALLRWCSYHRNISLKRRSFLPYTLPRHPLSSIKFTYTYIFLWWPQKHQILVYVENKTKDNVEPPLCFIHNVP